MNTPNSTAAYQLVSGGTTCPIFSARLHTSNGVGEPVTNIAGVAPFNAIGPALANTFNLNSSALCSIEALAGTAYTGGRQVNDVGHTLSSTTDAAIGGGTYGSVYNPSQFLG